jgi:hypothetical protein
VIARDFPGDSKLVPVGTVLKFKGYSTFGLNFEVEPHISFIVDLKEAQTHLQLVD